MQKDSYNNVQESNLVKARKIKSKSTGTQYIGTCEDNKVFVREVQIYYVR